MLRFFICVIVVILEFILVIPIMLIGLLIGLFSMKARDRFIKGVLDCFFGMINMVSGARVTYKGLEKIPRDCAVLYVANHASFFDVLLVAPKFPSTTGFVAKKSFEKVPIFAQCMKLSRSLFLDRDDIKQGLKVILAAIEQVKSGISIFIFPEGTRSRTGEMAEFKEGSMKVSVKSGCPIVPIAISNTAQVWENHFPWLEPAKVIIEVLDPIDPEDFDKDAKKHLGKYCHDLIENTKEKNDREISASGVN